MHVYLGMRSVPVALPASLMVSNVVRSLKRPNLKPNLAPTVIVVLGQRSYGCGGLHADRNKRGHVNLVQK